MNGLWTDLRIALRGLWRRPAFGIGVALTLGLGLGATIAVYTVVDRVVLRPLPYEDAGALVTIGAWSRTGGFAAPGVADLGPISARQYQNLRERAASFETLAAVDVERLLPPSLGLGRRVVAHALSADLLDLLGSPPPAAGRVFLPEDYGQAFGPRLNLTRPVMITYDAWLRRFGGDPDVIGRPLGNAPEGPLLVGVLSRGFRPLEAFSAAGESPDFYYAGGADSAPPEQGWEPVYVLGRLRPGVTVERARDEVERLAAELAAGSPEMAGASLPPGVRVGLNGLQAQTVGASRPQLALFLGAAALLLALAVMNGATLLLVRALDRTRELSVRMALGAGRARTMRLLVAEGAILSLAGAALGVVLARGGLSVFVRYAPRSIARLDEVAIDARVLAVTALLSLAVGVTMGLLPALRATRRDAGTLIRRSDRATPEGSALRSALVAGQMAVAIVLLSGAGLLFNSFVRLRAVDPGFVADGLVTVMVPYKGAAAVQGLDNPQAWDRVLERLATIPGVESVAGTTTLPFETPFLRVGVEGPDGAVGAGGGGERVAAYAVTPGYRRTMGTALLQGRDLEGGDGPGAERVALVNESFTRSVLGRIDPVGATIRLVDGGDEFRVVGEVEDVVQTRAEEGFRPAIYFSYAQLSPMAGVQAVVRTSLPESTVTPEVRRVAAEFAELDEVVTGTMRARISRTRTSPRFQALLIGAFAIVSLLLAAVGLYGSLAHHVGRSRRELGVRMALGADRGRVLALVMGKGMRLALAGVVAGLIGARLSTRLMDGLLYGVRPDDPLTPAIAGSVLLAVAVLACLGPARRATVVDPVDVIRTE